MTEQSSRDRSASGIASTKEAFMSVVSDPGLRATSRLQGSQFDQAPGANPLVRDVELRSMAPSPRRRVAVYATLAIASVALVLRVIASLVALPLETPPLNGVGPTWMVEVTTTSATPTTALLYGRDIGVQLVCVPARGTDEPRLVPARLAKGELHLISLGLASLHVHASSPRGAQPMTFDATSPVITAYHHPRAIGVRTGW